MLPSSYYMLQARQQRNESRREHQSFYSISLAIAPAVSCASVQKSGTEFFPSTVLRQGPTSFFTAVTARAVAVFLCTMAPRRALHCEE
eukprot:8515-Pelagomonas_calceolata.AAC.6